MPDSITPATNNLTPQESKAANIREQVKQLTGISFSGPQGDQWAETILDAVSVGARQVNPDEEDAPLHCCAEWHFARFTGPGSKFVPLLYAISFHVAGESGNFFPTLEKLAPFLNTKRDNIYAAARLLVVGGWWEVIEKEHGKPVKYRPVGHKEWEQRHSGRCTKKIEVEYVHDDEELAKLGRALGAILGGEKFHKNILLGVRNAAPNGSSDEDIRAHGKKFLAIDKGKGSGKERRKRFLKYLREQPETY